MGNGVMARTLSMGVNGVNGFPVHVEVFGVGGIPGRGRDYSISQVGPSPESRDALLEARRRGLKTAAKVQLNNSWELSAIPYLPVPYLLQEHLERLEAEKVDGLMLSWTLGGYPGGNLELLNVRTVEELAARKFSPALAPQVCHAWRLFSDAFRNFPFDLQVVYDAPVNSGPMDLLYLKPSGYKATMVGYPYDDLESWRSCYPEETFEEQFRLLSEGWKAGLDFLGTLSHLVTEADRTEWEELTTLSRAAYCHLRSAYLQIHFVRLRNAGRTAELPAVIREEKALALDLLGIVRRDTRIGFEASNHYYYTPNDLAEKALQCDHLLKELE